MKPQQIFSFFFVKSLWIVEKKLLVRLFRFEFQKLIFFLYLELFIKYFITFLNFYCASFFWTSYMSDSCSNLLFIKLLTLHPYKNPEAKILKPFSFFYRPNIKKSLFKSNLKLENKTLRNILLALLKFPNFTAGTNFILVQSYNWKYHLHYPPAVFFMVSYLFLFFRFKKKKKFNLKNVIMLVRVKKSFVEFSTFSSFSTGKFN